MSGGCNAWSWGIKEWKAMKKTVSFSVYVAESLKARAHRRRRTLEEIRYVTARGGARAPSPRLRSNSAIKSGSKKSIPAKPLKRGGGGGAGIFGDFALESAPGRY
ncbi:MAG: hypothetical protein V8Q16_06165 [Akkermansia muciniphila]